MEKEEGNRVDLGFVLRVVSGDSEADEERDEKD